MKRFTQFFACLFLVFFICFVSNFSVFGQTQNEEEEEIIEVEQHPEGFYKDIEISIEDVVNEPIESLEEEKEEAPFCCILYMEQNAVFEGGMDYFKEVVNNQMRFSETMKEGRVFIQFVVEKTGKVSEIKVIKGLSEENDKEALRIMTLISENYSWKPAEQRGKKVKVRMSIPIFFKEENTIPIEINDSLQNVLLDLSFLDSIKIPAVEIKREEEEEEEVFSFDASSNPIFEGGWGNFNEIIEKNLQFPKGGKEGRVLLWFVVDTTGKMIDFEVKESPNEENSKETLRVMNLINESHSWKPRIDSKTGKKYKVRLAMFITFKK
ncbi:energy transducer TonB [Bernardetia sp. ABR2-2B]|uniref:energy transducer TonB n=1 Tax=Bernardetia sp. ABR2-2B TaxID=3127472 RepID=UPI0030D141A6